MGNLKSAQEVKDQEGRQYHTATAPGEVSEYILLCGDPARVDLVKRHFSQIEVENHYREFITVTGIYRGMRLTVCSTGIGTDNMEIVIVELSQCVNNPTWIRLGTCGSLQPFIHLGEMVITSGAMRLENTTLHYVPEAYPAVAHYEVVRALEEAAREESAACHIGLTATSSSFYGGQGRTVGSFKPRNPRLAEDLRELNIYNMEMEISALLTLASLRNFRAGAICTVFADRVNDRFLEADKRIEAEELLVKVGLSSIKKLWESDCKMTE